MEEPTTQTEQEGQKAQTEQEGEKPESAVEKIISRHEGRFPQVTEEKVEAPAQPLITEDLAAQYPETKTLVGKPVSELGKSYSELNKAFNKVSQELSALKSKPAPVAPAVEAKKESVPEKSLEEKIAAIKARKKPDPVDDPKGFEDAIDKAQEEIFNLRAEAALHPYKSALDERKAQADAQSQMAVATKILSDNLPQDADMKAIEDGFKESVKDLIAENPRYYEGRPELLASHVLTFYYKSVAEQALSGKVAEVKKAGEALKSKLSEAPESATRQVVTPGGKIELSASEALAQRIVERNEKRFLANQRQSKGR